MNKIQQQVHDYYQTLNTLGINQGYKKAYKKIDELTKIAEEKLELDLLIKRQEMDVRTEDLSRFCNPDNYNGEYQVLTGTYVYEGQTFYDKEDFIESLKEEFKEDLKEGYELDELIDIEDYFEPDEIYNDYLFAYYVDDINIDIAQKCGLSVVEISEYDGSWWKEDTYLSLGGCGMDLSFKKHLYTGFRFGCVDSHFNIRDLHWLLDNTSNEKALEFLMAVGIKEDLAKKYIEQYKSR